MKKRQYASIWKNIGVALQLILSVVLVMAIFLFAALVEKNMFDSRDITNKKFVDAGCYTELFRNKTRSLMDFLKIRGKFETDGVYNPDKTVNILRYAKDGTIAGNLEDHVMIVAENEEGYYEYSASITNASSDMTENEMQLMLSNYTLRDLVSWAKDGYVNTNGRLEESYLPICGISIADALKDGRISKVQADHLYSALETTLITIGKEAKAYKRGLNEFQTEESNLTYCFKENGKVLYSNIDSQNDYLAYARARGSYLHYDGVSLKLRTNVTGMEDYFYQTLDNVISHMGTGQPELTVAVDTGFGEEDDFLELKKEFERLHPWVLISVVTIIVSLFGWVIVLVYLTTVTGHREEDEAIHLNFMDRIKTELFFGSYVIVTILLIVMCISMSQSAWGIPGMLVMAGVGAFIFDAIFILFYLSMVRRMKAGTLWEHSLLNWLLRGIGRILRSWKSSVQLMVIFLANILLFLCLAYGSFAGRNVVAIAGMVLLIGAWAVRYLRDSVGKREIVHGIKTITNGDLSYKLPLDNYHGDTKELAEAVNNIGDGLQNAVVESTKNERMKADLITNVSHDIKTPLTSIINYVNLLKFEPIEGERAKNYIHILDEKSQRLRQLTEDLVEASRISSGNITLQMTNINLVELIYQTGGEFNEKFEAKDLTTITKLPKEPAMISADSRRIWRVVENLYNNVAKYAMAHTRVYVTLEKTEKEVTFSIKNISEQPLTVTSTDLTERFIRGDVSRTTEGSGLGLSIAKNLTTLMGGTFDLELDGDLFTAKIIFPLVE